jgi:hypothetical protein
MIFQQGTVNLSALIVPDIYVQIIPPQFLLNGVPTNIGGVVGTAQWGPLNSPTLVATMADYARLFGAVMARKYDMGTPVALAVLQGGANFRCNRVSDGTDTAASAVSVALVDNTQQVTIGGTVAGGTTQTINITPSGGTLTAISYLTQVSDTTQLIAVALAAAINANAYLQSQNILADTAASSIFRIHFGSPAPAIASVPGGSTTITVAVAATTSTPGITLVGKYTGTLGNSITGALAIGSQVGTWKLTISIPGQQPERYDNIGFGLVGNPLRKAIASAVNNGNSGLRGPSQICTCSAGNSTQAVVAIATTGFVFSGGTDGAAITTQALLGLDTYPRTGMYALRAQGVSVAMLADCDDSTTWSAQVSFGLAEGIYMIATGPASDTITNAITTLQSAGIDTYAMKMMFGDWIYWNDVVNGNPQRLISPQGPVLGMLMNLSPEQSSLNKSMFGIVGTQKGLSGLTYSQAELEQLIGAGIEVIANPEPGGHYFGCRSGHNVSSNPAIHGDNYTRMTNYIAATLNKGMGIYVGQLQTPDERRRAKVTLDSYFQELYQFGMIGTPDGLTLPWKVILDNTNNPFNLVSLGYQIADVQVTYLSVVEKFIINLQGGQTVQIIKPNSVQNVTATS